MSTTLGKLLNPNDVGMDGVLVIGQSNNHYGAGLDTTYFDVTDPRIVQLASSGTNQGKFIAGVEPLFFRDQQAGCVSYAANFARHKLRTTPANRRICILPCAQGNTGFDPALAPATWQTNGSLYTFAKAAVTTFLAENPNNRMSAVLFHLGEHDSFIMSGATFGGYLDAVIDDLRTLVPNVPFIVGELPPYYAGGSNFAQIIATEVDTPRRKVRAGYWYAPTPVTQRGDNIHYDAAQQRKNGYAAWLAYQRALTNVLGTAPVVPSSLTLTQAGTTLSATWGQVSGRVTDYSVRYRVNGGTWTALTRTQSIDVHASITGLTLGTAVGVEVATVNEQGTSAWSAETTLTLVRLPNQASVALGTPTSSALPYTITAPAVDGTHAAATSYLVEYKRTADSTWTTFGTVTALTGTVTGLIDTTGYDVRVTAINAAGSGTVSATASATTATPTPLLTEMAVTGYRAYGLRKLRTGVTSAIRVRRSSDNTETDIGFVGNNLDTAALLTFAGAGSAYVKTFYDQSGGGRDISAISAGAQGRIVNAGVLETTGTGAAVRVTPATTLYADAVTGLYAAGAASLLYVAKPVAVATSFCVAAEATTVGAASNLYAPAYVTGTGGNFPTALVKDSAGSQFAFALATTGGLGTAVHQVSVVDTGSALSAWTDGTVDTGLNAAAYSRSARTVTPTGFVIGGLDTDTPASGSGDFLLAELVAFTSAITTTARQIGEANQKAFYATP